MKVIDLLNRIANGEEVPKIIQHRGYIYEYQHRRDTENAFNYMCNENGEYLSRRYYLDNILNEEVEIIFNGNTLETACKGIRKLGKELRELHDTKEEKKIPEKLEAMLEYSKYGNPISKAPNNEQLMFKINEIIEYLKIKGE